MLPGPAAASAPDPWWGLGPVDRWMAALRAVAFLGGLAWWVAHPLPGAARSSVLALLGLFAFYSGLLYVLHLRHPGSLGRLYRVAMGLDLGFIVLLVRATGGMASDFYLAFYVLIALHAFYFGLGTGVGLALAAGGAYLALVDRWPLPVHPADAGLRVGCFLVVGVCMGIIAERERRERRLVEALNQDLRAQHRHLQEAQEHLVRSDRLATIGELAAGLAHELRNPLAGIAGALVVLGKDPVFPAQHQALLAEIREQITRMNRTLTDLLGHARPPAPQYLALSINEVLEQSLWFLPVAEQPTITVERALEADLPLLWLDPNLLHQAFLNLLVNARQAMPHGGTLTIRSARRRDAAGAGEAVEVTIADTGVGITAEHQAQIFQPFFTTRAQGTGLGLAIAGRIVAQHGGRIEVDSAPGCGATFRVILPVRSPHTNGRPSHGAQAAHR